MDLYWWIFWKSHKLKEKQMSTTVHQPNGVGASVIFVGGFPLLSWCTTTIYWDLFQTRTILAYCRYPRLHSLTSLYSIGSCPCLVLFSVICSLSLTLDSSLHQKISLIAIIKYWKDNTVCSSVWHAYDLNIVTAKRYLTQNLEEEISCIFLKSFSGTIRTLKANLHVPILFSISCLLKFNYN